MPAYILACDQVGIPSTTIASDGTISMACAGGTVSIIEYQPTIFVPLSPGQAAHVSMAVLLLWSSVWMWRLLTNFVSKGNNHDSD